MLNGLLNLPGWGLVGVTLLLTHITILGVTIYLHRHQAHRALDLHPIVSHFFRFWLWLTTGMVTKQWVAVHRKHHGKCETADDPHSPQVLGIKKVLLEGSELYRGEAEKPETLARYGAGTPDDWIERHVYSAHPYYGIALMFGIDVLLFGAFGITVWAVQMAWIPFWAAGVINGIGHFWGYRNYETQDASSNISPIGILVGGEELHNNHHAYPASARLSARWWEFDIGWMYIRIFEILRLARVKVLPPRVTLVPGKGWIDAATVSAVIRNRFDVLALYSRSVIKPVFRHEAEAVDPALRPLLKRARRFLLRDSLPSGKNPDLTLQQALTLSERLSTVYRFKEQLKELWAHTSLAPELRLQQLSEWCQRAEQSGIEALGNFAATLKRYEIRTA